MPERQMLEVGNDKIYLYPEPLSVQFSGELCIYATEYVMSNIHY
jgi:hypothetical protein